MDDWAASGEAPMTHDGPAVPPSFSPVHRDGQTRSRVAVGLLAVIAALLAVEAWHFVSGFDLIRRAERGLVSDAELIAWDDTTALLATAYVAASIACAVSFLAWLSRTVDNTPVLTGGVPSVTPRWSIGWWFIPIVNLWKPYQIVKDLAVRHAAPSVTAKTGLILAWWLVLTAGSLFSTILARLPITAPDSFRTFLTVGAVSDVALVVAALLGLAVVVHIQSLATARFATGPT